MYIIWLLDFLIITGDQRRADPLFGGFRSDSNIWIWESANNDIFRSDIKLSVGNDGGFVEGFTEL